MRTDLTSRLAAIEDRRKQTSDRASEMARSAAVVLDKLTSYASQFAVSDSSIPLDERLARMSPAQHCAWEMRFKPEPLSIAAVMRLHGFSMPRGRAR